MNDPTPPDGPMPPPTIRLSLAMAGDAALAQALIAGDDRAPRLAWARYVPMVRGMLRRALGSDPEIEDLIQNVFFVLFRKVGGLREPSALKAYVASITSMTIKYEIRRRRMTRKLRLSDAASRAEHLTTEQPDAVAREALISFYALLDRLREPDRVAFIMRFFERLEVIEVALALGVSVSTVKRRLTRIQKRVTVLIRQSPALASFLENADVALTNGRAGTTRRRDSATPSPLPTSAVRTRVSAARDRYPAGLAGPSRGQNVAALASC